MYFLMEYWQNFDMLAAKVTNDSFRTSYSMLLDVNQCSGTSTEENIWATLNYSHR